MADYKILLPSQPRIISEEGETGVFEIEGLYPGYGHTLGNSLRRIILSSLPGVAITSVKITGITHEFSTIDGVKEDVITILLNLKKIRMRFTTDEPQVLNLKIKGSSEERVVKASDLDVPGQVEILTPDETIATLVGKNAVLEMEIRAEKGLGFMPKEMIDKSRVDIGTIALDGIFTPIRRASYEVENMRVGDRTDFNKLRMHIETDGTLSPSDALTYAVNLMIQQLKSIVGFKEEEPEEKEIPTRESAPISGPAIDPEVLKTRIDALDLSARTKHALSTVNIRTVGGLSRKKEKDIADIDGLGAKGLQEIKKALGEFGITLK